MQKPKMWNSKGELIEDLRGRWPDFSDPVVEISDWEELLRSPKAVSGNTFRSFRHMRERPSLVFRDWACDAFLHRRGLQDLYDISCINDYDKWMRELVRNLQIAWCKRMGVQMPFGPSFKLSNLLLKAISEKLYKEDSKDIRPYIHVAWDKYTLVGLRAFVRWKNGGEIAVTSTMRSVESPLEYTHLLQEIRDIASVAGVPPVAYDYLAWNAGHSKGAICR